MSNIYLKKYKDILETYFDRQKELNQLEEDNNKTYAPAVAQMKNREIEETKAQAYEGAKGLIEHIFKEVKTLLAYASFINVEDLTADRLIFESGFELTKQDIQAYLERYADNYTMKRLIADWVKKQPKPEQYGDINFALPSDQLEVYKQFGEKAVYLCDKIFGNGWSAELGIENFEDATMNANKLAVIGSGEELASCKSKRVPNAQLHIFDGVKLDTHSGNGYEYMH